MQNPLNGLAGTNPLVDSLIGNAYEVVKYVAYYVKEIRYVALNMATIYRVSQAMYENQFKVLAITALDATYEIDLPEGVTAGMVIGTSVTVLTAAGEIYGSSDTTFTWTISDGKLVVVVPAGAPGSFVGADIRWLINWQSPVQIS